MKRKFEVELRSFVDIEIDEKVINTIDEEWRQHLYNLTSPEEIACHIAYNLVFNNAKLSDLDGFADQNDYDVQIVSEERESEAKEIKNG